MIKIFIFTTSLIVGVLTFFFPKHVESPNRSVESTSKMLPPLACETLTGTAKIICMIDEFKATLNTTQLAALQLSYSLADAQKWSNLPNSLGTVRRVGVQFSTLSATQLVAVKNLLKAVTSTTPNEGFAELDAILAADDYLSVNGGGATYGSGNFFIAFLGTPSLTGKWELQFGGHHYTFANTYNNGVLVGATPSFRSSEPSGTFIYNGVTYQPMLQELAAFSAMLIALNTTEQTTAKLSATFTDLVLAPGKDWQFPATRQGLRVGDLSTDKKALVLAAIKTYINDLEDATATAILNKYTAELDNTYIAFSGTTAMTTKNDYVRIDGPSIWLEYSMQGGIVIRTENHPHSVWRDRTSDYGGTGNPNSVKYVDASVYKMECAPNPTTNQTTLKFTLPQEMSLKIAIYDMTGRMVKTVLNGKVTSGDNAISVDLNNLVAGIYTYTLETENGERATKRLVKL